MDTMDIRFANALVRSASTFFSRRRAFRGFAATVGLAALTPTATGAAKGQRKRRKKGRCDRCPERICCRCIGLSGPTACRFVASQAECEEFCDGALGGFGTVTGQPGFSAFCTTGNDCVVVECPVVPKR